MKNKIFENFAAIAFIILYIAMSTIAAICPDEFAFVFCSTVFTQYVEWVMYIYDLSEQFRLVWPWQR